MSRLFFSWFVKENVCGFTPLSVTSHACYYYEALINTWADAPKHFHEKNTLLLRLLGLGFWGDYY